MGSGIGGKMEGLLIGGATAVVTFIFAYSWLSTPNKKRFNRWFGNPVTDILVSVATLAIAGATATGLMTAIGLGIGLSICLKVSSWVFGRDERSGILYSLNRMVQGWIITLRDKY